MDVVGSFIVLKWHQTCDCLTEVFILAANVQNSGPDENANAYIIII